MFNETEIILENLKSISFEENLLERYEMNISSSNTNHDKTSGRFCARGRAVRAYTNILRFGFEKNSLSSTYENISDSDKIVTEQQSSISQAALQNEYQQKNLSLDMQKDPSLDMPNSSSLNIENKNESEKIFIDRHSLSRIEIEEEIGNMVRNVLRFERGKSSEQLYMGDSHCHFDVLFEKLNCPNQSIWSYIKYNYKIYEYGIDMQLIIQVYFAPKHFNRDNWLMIYSKYMDHDIIYGKCGLHPVFAHHFNLQMELNIRKAINHPRVVAIGEIGLDFRSALRPSEESQIYAFVQQLSIAREKNLPVVIHSQESFMETLEILCQELPKNYPLCWRHFEYSLEELDMLKSRFTNAYFACSPCIFINQNFKNVIQRLNINCLLIESVSPHLMLNECPHVWDTHPIFVAKVHEYVSAIFNLSIHETAHRIISNMKTFYKIN
ncbi:hypothetical protein I4U23_027358 [Adineta vaga]|nr:hypothetical protein I4U23_027358 [Adineta vaga]